MSEIGDWRKRIDEIDDQLVKLLNDRARCAVEIGHLKKKAGQPAWQPDRELEILRHVESANGGPLDNAAVRRLFERIIDEARSLERRTMVKDEPGGPADAGPGGSARRKE